MSARDVVLGRVRAAVGDAPQVPEVPRDYRQHGDLDADATVALFLERVDDYRARVHRCDADDLAATIAAALGDARRIVVPEGLDDGWLVPVSGDVEVVADAGALTPADLDGFDTVVTAAAVGIAETGTVVLDGRPDQGRRAITLVPDHHVCVVRADQVVQTVPEGLARLDPVRPLTMISGPSATSDIELDRVEGVHGPRVLDVIVVDH
ncbi:lactate utilization protein C [Egicoccus sp. AB-alg2]|uniref:LutC/YkgG family protein n=1 Tax=Egicoccus sp. AB-alg2 TaxID=3242693 RepID=UPI00359E273A